MVCVAALLLYSSGNLCQCTDVSARGDSITWLHEGSLSGPGGSAGLHAMQLLQVSHLQVASFLQCILLSICVGLVACMTLWHKQLNRSIWQMQHGIRLQAGWGSHTICHQLIADRNVLVRHHSRCTAFVSMHHTAPNTALRLLDIAKCSLVLACELQSVIDG